MSQDVVSFVLRFVREAGEEQQARWRGVVKHVQSNSESQFTQFAEALEFMQQQVGSVVDDAADAESATDPIGETAKLWGTWMPRYTETVVDQMASSRSVMARAMAQTMDATLSFWGLPTQASQRRAAEQVRELNEKLALMTAKVVDLEAKLAKLQPST